METEKDIVRRQITLWKAGDKSLRQAAKDADMNKAIFKWLANSPNGEVVRGRPVVLTAANETELVGFLLWLNDCELSVDVETVQKAVKIVSEGSALGPYSSLTAHAASLVAHTCAC